MSQWAERYSAVTKATRNGSLKPAREMKCEKCCAQSAHRHHEDYQKPLEVVYLCSKCHRARHKELGWGNSHRPKHYNFSKIPVGSYGKITAPNSRISQLVHWHQQLTGEQFKCFTWGNQTIVFRTK